LKKRIERLEALKLIAEIRLIRQQLSDSTKRIEWLKAIAGLAGVVTAFVALLGIYTSISRFQEEEKTKITVQQVQQLNRSIEQLADTNIGKKLAGISTIESFMRTGDRTTQEQILSVLISILSVEESKPARDAIISSFRSDIYNDVDGGVKENALKKLTDISRSLVIQGSLRKNRISHALRPAESDTIEAKAKSVSQAIVSLIGHGNSFTDFNGIYCVQCDFSGLTIENADFSNSILYLADFSNAVMVAANFDGADIDHTRFVGTTLRKAKFTLIDDPRPGYYRSSYISKLFDRERGEQAAVYGPNFNCSDLREADFSGHPIFGFSSENAKLEEGRASPLLSFSASFVGADLEGADFSSAIMFGAKAKEDGLPFPTGGGHNSVGIYELFEFEFSDYGIKEIDRAPYESDLSWLKRGFSGTNWDKAQFPPKLDDWLKQNQPPIYMDFGIRDKCTPVSSRDDFKPKLRIFDRDAISPEELTNAIDESDLELVLDLVSWSARVKKVDVYDLSAPERNILLAGRVYFSTKSRGLIELIASFEDKSDFDKLIHVLQEIGEKDMVIVLNKMNGVKFRNTTQVDFEDRVIAIEAQLIDMSLDRDTLEELAANQNEGLKKTILDYIAGSKIDLISSMRYNK
jgi:uncharacterized protein YjbI with pentapeptide repeats